MVVSVHNAQLEATAISAADEPVHACRVEVARQLAARDELATSIGARHLNLLAGEHVALVRARRTQVEILQVDESKLLAASERARH